MLRTIACVAATVLLSTAALGQTAGVISGRVVEETARPIAGARIELTPGSRRVISDSDGRFEFRNVESGKYTLTVQRIGFAPRTLDLAITPSGATPTIVLVTIPRILDSVRVSERAAPNRFSATVLDNGGQPIPDVAVSVEGVANLLHTDSLGHFTVPSQVHGTLVIRMRKIGYGAYLGSFRMIATRDDTLRMSRLAQGLAAVQITDESGFGRDSFVYKDLDQRMHWKTQQAAVVSREGELSAVGRVNLCEALKFTPTGAQYGVARACERSCVLLNGAGKTLMPARAYFADQVEMVEYYPPKSDWSNNLAARGCAGSTLVIWLRKDVPAKP